MTLEQPMNPCFSFLAKSYSRRIRSAVQASSTKCQVSKGRKHAELSIETIFIFLQSRIGSAKIGMPYLHSRNQGNTISEVINGKEVVQECIHASYWKAGLFAIQITQIFSHSRTYVFTQIWLCQLLVKQHDVVACYVCSSGMTGLLLLQQLLWLCCRLDLLLECLWKDRPLFINFVIDWDW